MESTPIDTILCTESTGSQWTRPGERRRLPASEAAGLQLYESHSKLIVAVAAFCAARFAFALSPGETVDNFRLPDHQGGSRELYYLSDMKAVVLMAQGNGCEASRQALPGLYGVVRFRYIDEAAAPKETVSRTRE